MSLGIYKNKASISIIIQHILKDDLNVCLIKLKNIPSEIINIVYSSSDKDLKNIFNFPLFQVYSN